MWFSQPVSDPSTLPHRRKVIVFCFMMLGHFMSVLDNQVVSTALPTIVGELGAFERFGWITSAYLLAECMVMPVYGKLGDLFGRKYILMTALTLFVLGSLACGTATSMNTLIAARVFQGFGAGGIIVTIFSINADLFPPRERAKFQSFTSLVIMAGGALGPFLGGTLAQMFGWRSIFLINLPLGIMALVALWFLLPRWRPARTPVIDYAGAVTLAVAIAAVVLWADASSLFGGMFTPTALILPAVALVALVLWRRIEQRAPEPILPLHLFRKRDFPLLLIVAVTSGGVGIGMINYHALYLQMTTGLAPATAGLFFIAITGGIAAGSLTAGRLTARTGMYKPWLVLGMALSACSLTVLSVLPVGVPYAVIAGTMLMQGVAVGLGQQAPIIGVQAVSPVADTGAATGSVTLSRMAGASLAISAFGAILASHLAQSHVSGLDHLTTLTPEAMAGMSPELRLDVAQTFRGIFGTIYLSGAGIILIGLCAALALSRTVLAPASSHRK